MRFIDAVKVFGLAILSWAAILPNIAWSEPAFVPFQKLAYQMDSGLHTYAEDEDAEPFSHQIQIPGAIWLRLQFGDCNLGTKSYIGITSLEDGSYQRLDMHSLPQWRNRSAFFNGDSVQVELFVAPGENGIFFTIDSVLYGGPTEGLFVTPEDFIPEEQCGGTDDRVPTTDPAVGRFVFFDVLNNRIALCTAYIASNGAYLTAGHCFMRSDHGDPDLMEFNVPDSDPDGSPNFALAVDQYPIDGTTYVRRENGRGDDWAVFDCFPNSNTGLLPPQAQNDFFRLSKDSSPTTIRITGHGKDFDDPERNRTLQTHTGPYLGENGSGSKVDVEYQVDTEGGNSGGPVIINGTETSIGIHAHGGCDLGTGEGNHGTSFENDDLEAAIQDFKGTNVIYVDSGHSVSSALESGTVLRPYDTVSEAVTEVSSGGIISIVKGTYSRTAGNTFTLGVDGKSMMLEAPVGTVTIGN